MDAINQMSKDFSRADFEAYLLNAHVALEAGKLETALNFLGNLDPTQLPADLKNRFYALRGEVLVKLNRYPEGLADLVQALALLEAAPETTAIETGRVRNWLGLAYYYQNKHYQAIEQHERCLLIIAENNLPHKRFQFDIHLNLGNEYSAIGNPEKALQYYRKALNLVEKGETDVFEAGIYWGMALVYRQMKNLAMAKLYFAKSADLYEHLDKPGLAASMKGQLGVILIERGELEEATVVLEAALQLAQLINKPAPLWYSYINLAFLYFEKQLQAQALEYGEKALQLAEALKDKLLLGQSLAQIGRIKAALRDEAETISYFEKALAILEETHDVGTLQKVYYRYANILEEWGNLREAIRMYRKANEGQPPGKSLQSSDARL